MVKYEISTIIKTDFDKAKSIITEALKAEGFGILTEIDVKKTMKQKLNEDFENYIILGACNPHFAKKSLDIEREIGLLLPCNVIVQEKDKNIIKIATIDPEAMFQVINNPKMDDIVDEVKESLKRVINSLRT